LTDDGHGDCRPEGEVCGCFATCLIIAYRPANLLAVNHHTSRILAPAASVRAGQAWARGRKGRRSLVVAVVVAVSLSGAVVPAWPAATLAGPEWGDPTRPLAAPWQADPRIFLPLATHSLAPAVAYPDAALAERIWVAVDAFVTAHPPEAIYPGYAADTAGPSVAGATANVEAACHDFPDLPNDFGPGVHHRACYEWVADYLGLYHAARARHEQAHGRDGDGDLAWARSYLDVALHYLAMMVYGPEDAPGGEGYRDTRAAIWQNPLRAVNVAIVADILRAEGELAPEARARTESRSRRPPRPMPASLTAPTWPSIPPYGMQATGLQATARTGDEAVRNLVGRAFAASGAPARAVAHAFDGLHSLNKVVVAEVTATIRGIPHELLLGQAEGLAPCVANFDNVHVNAKRLVSVQPMEPHAGGCSALPAEQIQRLLSARAIFHRSSPWRESTAPKHENRPGHFRSRGERLFSRK
jgi:hypothetical protein